jgi:hypothetical protein
VRVDHGTPADGVFGRYGMRLKGWQMQLLMILAIHAVALGSMAYGLRRV